MQYSWAIATVVVLLIGSSAAGIAIQRSGMRSPIGRNLQIGTTVSILGILIHNVFWEREINEMASKGWTLLYTMPVFMVCISVSGVLSILFVVRYRRFRIQDRDQPTSEDNQEAEQGGDGDAEEGV